MLPNKVSVHVGTGQYQMLQRNVSSLVRPAFFPRKGSRRYPCVARKHSRCPSLCFFKNSVKVVFKIVWKWAY